MDCIYDLCCGRVRSLPSLKTHTAACICFTKYAVMSRRTVLQCCWILTQLFLLLWHTDWNFSMHIVLVFMCIVLLCVYCCLNIL